MTYLYFISGIKVSVAYSNQDLKLMILKRLKISETELKSFKVVKSSIDARKKPKVLLVLNVEVETLTRVSVLKGDIRPLEVSTLEIPVPQAFQSRLSHRTETPYIVVGSGPAGLFCALALSEAGLPVVLLERGKAVEGRLKDIGLLRAKGVLNPESNICFGEGGAGTYTDGKLYTRIKHPYLKYFMKRLVEFGAPSDILSAAQPHLGTDKLVAIIKNIRQTLLDRGVDIRFETRMQRLVLEDGCVKGVQLQTGETVSGQAVILALGHSARETFEELHLQGVQMEAKSFAVGLRAGHSQSFIDRSQYGMLGLKKSLGAAPYRLTYQCKDPILKQRGVYSFCMCPGGFIVPSPTEVGHMAINGMSNSNRSADYANSGIVVQIEREDLIQAGFKDSPLMGIEFQRSLESIVFKACSHEYYAPAMRIDDFVEKKFSGNLSGTSFKPGADPIDLWDVLPHSVLNPLREGLKAFDRKLKGYVSAEANLFAVESRTSSPLRITRDENLMSVNTRNLYPAGEGAGYAGGIVSAGVDGLKVAESIIEGLKV